MNTEETGNRMYARGDIGKILTVLFFRANANSKQF